MIGISSRYLLGPCNVVNLPLVLVVEVVKDLLGPGSTSAIREELLIHLPANGVPLAVDNT